MNYNLGLDIDDVQRRTAMTLLIKTVHERAAQEELSSGELREGLKDTPTRAAKAWAHWLGGYDTDPADLMAIFEDGGENYDEMVVVCDIPVYSHCEHHLSPIFGRACVGYIPDGRILGLSKMHRIVDAFARRLQTQERLTAQIANTLMTGGLLKPQGVGVILRCRHMCIESRGVSQQGTVTSTSASHGVIRDEPETRAEFLSLARFEATI